MTRRPIEIKVDLKTGVITYSESAARAKRKDEIHWVCQAGPFALQFTGATPVDFQGGRSTGSHRGGPYELTGQVPEDAASGVYQYGCSVYAGETLYLDARCPVIIIDPDG